MTGPIFSLSIQEAPASPPDFIPPLDIWSTQQTIIPSMRSRAARKSFLVNKIGNVRKELESNAEEREKELLEEKERVEEEIRRFWNEELELVKAGGDPLITCKHCHHMFESYRGYERHKCQHILQPEDGDVEHFEVLTGSDRDEFVRLVDRMSTYKKIQLCICTSKAVKGIFPLLFPSKHDVSTARFAEVGCMGEAAYSSLRQALKEDTLHLPSKLVLDLPDGGGELYLPPSLLTPRPRTAGWKARISVKEDPDAAWLSVKSEVDTSAKMYDTEEEEMDAFIPDRFSKEDSEDEDDDEFLEQLGGGAGGAGAVGGGSQGGGQGGGAPRPSGAVGSGGAAITAEERRVSPN